MTRRCRICGCTDDDCSGCVERTGVPCHWVEPDLCSACTANVPLPSVIGMSEGMMIVFEYEPTDANKAMARRVAEAMVEAVAIDGRADG